MTGSQPNSQRARSILQSIVESYIETGEPVGSRTLSRAGGQHLSPASIRNVMADLFDDGYLSQPHTSAGRVPTVKAFRAYVESLATRRLSLSEVNRLRNELGRTESVEERLGKTSHLLTKMTRNVGIAMAVPSGIQRLDHVEFVRLSGKRVLMIVETRDRMVRNRVVSLEEEVTQDDLNTVRNYLNVHYAGWSLAAIRGDLRGKLAEEQATYDSLLRQLHALYEKGLLEVDANPEVHLEGTSNLVIADLQSNRERLREIFRTLEEKQRLLQLLDHFMDQSRSDVAVQVGLGDLHSSLEGLSLIGLSVALPTGLQTRVAVLGPIRMNYGQVVSTVYHVGEAIQSIS